MKFGDLWLRTLVMLEPPADPPRIIADLVMLVTCIIVARKIGKRPLDVKHHGYGPLVYHTWDMRRDAGFVAYTEVMKALYQVHPRAERVLRRLKLI